MTVQDTFAATLVDEWVRAGVTDTVVAPGSRSTPLAMALANEPRLRLHVVLDERSAAFFALGLGLSSGRPAVLLTTSGTAAVELHPAMVEAHQAGVPLLACTADRPPELHGVGAPQTVDQERLFAGVLRARLAPGVADAATSSTWRSIAARAVLETRSNPAGPGPVHLNLAFRDPLTGAPGPMPPGRDGGAAWHLRAPAMAMPALEVVAELAGHGGRGVIVAGGGAGDPEAVHALAEALGWPLLADPRSGCRRPGPHTVAAADALLRIDRFAQENRPELVLRLGAPWASRVVGDWLSALDATQYLVDPHGSWLDPSRTAATVISADPTLLARAVAGASVLRPAPVAWVSRWRTAEAAAQAALDTELGPLEGQDELTEPGIARALVGGVPEGSALVVSSSMPVRDVEWYGRPRSGLRVLSNRGANGIDGVLSTALGVAATAPGPTFALVGDLAFLHDATGLCSARSSDRPGDCTIVVVDNGGGGIFSFLPQAGELSPEVFERVLATPHGLDLVAVASALGARSEEVMSVKALVSAIDATECGDPGPRVLVARTDREANVAAHERLHQAVAEAVAGAAT